MNCREAFYFAELAIRKGVRVRLGADHGVWYCEVVK